MLLKIEQQAYGKIYKYNNNGRTVAQIQIRMLNESDCNVIWVENLYINTAYRRQGLARNLNNEIIKRHKHALLICYVARGDHMPMVGLLSQFNFFPVAYLENGTVYVRIPQ